MAKVTMPLMSATASGKIGNEIVFDHRGIVRKWVKPANPQTAGQVAQRNLLKDVQAELFLLGAVLRAQLKTEFGARWNSDIVGDLLSNNANALLAYAAEYAAFGAPNKANWVTADPATPTVRADGELLYIVASAVYDRAVRLGATITLTLPIETNSATVGAEWVDNTP